MKNYQCKKCKTVLQSAARPKVTNCPTGFNHDWNDLGFVGMENYQCSKCGLVLKSKGRPGVTYCPSGLNHQWTKL